MATNSQYLNGQLSDAQIEQLIQSLRGIKPVENDILNKYKLFREYSLSRPWHTKGHQGQKKRILYIQSSRPD
jgi:hypothetical protein